ncbi:hypothetical protein K7711_15835 [Nocardia sp. CA2R105]|uniref:hypothetical protein n=1 Tax=Nocardia coffeae TaxID=2873381 RepID=UPI001CA747B5|nr:hypothetical protein [Nocardia coffeae]MBY8857956.1 hypothetical protein [Nocardia coffeae]
MTPSRAFDFLLAFSCLLVAHDNWGSLSLRKFVTRFASHFDPQSWKGPKALAGCR